VIRKNRVGRESNVFEIDVFTFLHNSQRSIRSTNQQEQRYMHETMRVANNEYIWFQGGYLFIFGDISCSLDQGRKSPKWF